MKKAINIRIDEKLLSILDEKAKQSERTRTYIIEKAIFRYLNEITFEVSEAQSDYQTSHESTITLKINEYDELRESLEIFRDINTARQQMEAGEALLHEEVVGLFR